MPYDKTLTRENGGRIFAALLDIQITFFLLYLDMHMAGATWNTTFSKGKLEGGSILDSQDKFFGKMDIHRAYSAYILRYRAFWDKLMGLLVLAESPEDYESFVQARSKKRSFIRIAAKNRAIPQDFVLFIKDKLNDFDDKFRTAEAHGTGMLRKYSFKMESMADNPQIQLIGYWNVVVLFAGRLGRIFG